MKQYAAAPNDRELPKADDFLQQQCRGEGDLDRRGMGPGAIQHAKICKAPGQGLVTRMEQMRHPGVPHLATARRSTRGNALMGCGLR